MTRPLNVLDRWVGGTRGGHRGATGGGWSERDSATRWHGARWEISYAPYTCVTCRLHVCLPDMKIVTRQFAARVRGVWAGRHAHDGLSRRHGADARGWLTVTRPRGREKALKPFGWMSHRAERIVSGPPPLTAVHARRVGAVMDRRPELLRSGMHAGRARCGCTMGIPCPASGERTSLAASMPGTLAWRGRLSPWRDADAAR